MSYVTIRGTGFNNISEVWFGQGKADTWSVNPNYNEIYAQVPITATTGRIRLISTRRQKTGIAAQSSGFWTIPKLTNYIQTSFNEIPGAYIHLDGYHMAGITGATINNLALTAPPAIVNNNRVLLVAPSGNCRGQFRVQSTGNIRVTSTFSYNPNIMITGVNKTGLLTGDFLLVTGRYWVPELMSSAGGSNYYGKIGDDGQRMLFTRINHQVLSGTVPTGAKNGTVYIEREDGYCYSNNNIRLNIYNSPFVSGWYDRLVNYRLSTYVYGNNLNMITGIDYIPNYTGVTPYGKFNFTGWSINYDGTKININTSGFNTGHAVYVSGNTPFQYGFDFYFLSPYGNQYLGTGNTGQTDNRLEFRLQRPAENTVDVFSRIVFSGFPTVPETPLTGSNGFFTGSGLVQRRGYFLNVPIGYWIEYRFSGISGFNWYATGSAAGATGYASNDQNGYGLPRNKRCESTANNQRFIYLGSTGWPFVGSGLLKSTQYSGLATGDYWFGYTVVGGDGFVTGTSGLIRIR